MQHDKTQRWMKEKKEEEKKEIRFQTNSELWNPLGSRQLEHMYMESGAASREMAEGGVTRRVNQLINHAFKPFCPAIEISKMSRV